MSVRGFTLSFDWTRNGTYSGPYEDVSSYVDAADDLITQMGRDTSQAGAALPAGTLGFTLIDPTRVFAPENSASPIATDVLPGVPAKLDLTVSGNTTTLFSGSLFDSEHSSQGPTGGVLTGTIQDSWGAPGAEQLSTPLYTGQRTGTLIGVILDAIGWTGPRDLDNGATLVPYWWAEGKDAATAIQELVDSEGPPAIAYVDAGTFVFRDRHHRLVRTASTTSQATFSHVIPAGAAPADFKIGEFTYRHGLPNIVNSVVFEVDQRAPRDEAAIWSSNDPISLASGQTVALAISSGDPFLNALTPVLGTDYTLAGGTVSMSLSRTSGASLTLTIVCSSAAVINSLQIRGTPLPVARTVKVEEYDTGSIARFGRRAWPRTVPWCNAYDADAIAQRIIGSYATARPVITFTIDGIVSTAYLQQFALRDISDRITVRNDVTGINGPYIIERIKRTIKQLGLGGTVLEITCEVPDPTQPSNAFTFDVAGKGFNDGAFGVDGIDNAATMFTFDVAGRGFDQGRFAT